MGGSLKIVIKEKDVYYPRIVHTNFMPFFVQNDKFIENNKDYIGRLKKVKSPYGKIQDNLISAYDYGIDFFDLDNKIIINSQGYCSYDYIMKNSIYLYLNGNITGKNKYGEDYYPKVFKRMYQKGMIIPKKLIRNDEFEKIDNFDINKFYSKPNRYFRKKDIIIFEIQWERFGWKYLKFEDEGRLETCEFIFDNYKLSDNDLEDWKNELLKGDEDHIINNFFKKLKVKKRKEKLNKLNEEK